MSCRPLRTDVRPEIWGGLECTIARIGDGQRDQFADTGHYDRAHDLDAIASLGIRACRYPVLLERVAPDLDRAPAWGWHDEQLGRLRDLSLAPIVGLVHHGSGPRYTSLLDPSFPDIVGRHARNVAERYPWVDMFTPVNEPLTTARFSGLYGHWYPHRRSYRAFLRALVLQSLAVVKAMAAIRAVRPDAKLVQTEDLGKTFSTPLLAYQAEHENERRWLAFDLLCGRVDASHSWHRILTDNGIPDATLRAFLEAPCPPDIIGVNHYLTSDRYLDQAMRRYPPAARGGNGRHVYADVAAARVDLPPDEVGPKARLMEVWERFRLPIAITEVHNGSTRDEQLRWLMHVWAAACGARAEGVDLRAVTVWSLLGSLDWDSLLTERRGSYEAGAFDIRSNPVRPTALAVATRSLATTGRYDHPVLDKPGWWSRSDRFHATPLVETSDLAPMQARSVLIAGAESVLGQAFVRSCEIRHIAFVPLESPTESDRDSLEAALARHRPWAVVAADRLSPEAAPPDRCDGRPMLAKACAAERVQFVTFSSHHVFAGASRRPCVESDPVCPESSRGRQETEVEAAVLSAHPEALIVRTGALMGGRSGEDFVHHALAALAAGEEFEAPDVPLSVTYGCDLVDVTLDLLIDAESGLWHLCNERAPPFCELVRFAADLARVPTRRLTRCAETAERWAILASERGRLMMPIEQALRRYVDEDPERWTRVAARQEERAELAEFSPRIALRGPDLFATPPEK